MKRTEIKRKTPLKKTAFKKKPKRKKKTALQKRIDKMDSPYWDKKCKAAVAEFMHTQKCLACGHKEPYVRLVCGHHLIRKSRSRLYRWHPMNIIPLCEKHHLSGTELAAHSDNVLAVAAFVQWLTGEPGGYYEWLVQARRSMDEIKHTVSQIERPDWRYQYEIWRQRIRDTRIIQEQ